MHMFTGREERPAYSIRTQLLAIMIALILPLNFLVLFTTTNSIYVAREQADASLQNMTNLYLEQMEHRIENVYQYFYELENSNPYFIQLLYQDYDYSHYYLAQTNLAQDFSDNVNASSSAECFFYRDDNQEEALLVMQSGYKEGTSVREQRGALVRWLENAEFDQGGRWKLVTIDDARFLLRFSHRENFYYGALIYLDSFCESLQHSISYEGAQVFASREAPSGWDEDRVGVSGKLTQTDASIYVSIPREEVLLTLPIGQWLAMVMAAIYLMLIPVLYYAFYRLLLRPLNKINSALLRMKEGEKDYRISHHRYAREFRQINTSFNEMADNIKYLKIENYEKELERRKLELRTLQLQIRPHFLLNTFSLVYSLAELREYQSIQKLALYLSNYFRYIFRSGKELEPLRKELNLIREYMDVSAIRYPGRFRVEYLLDPRDEELLDFRVPPLLVHSFVENIINHAMKIGEVTHIRLAVKQENGFVVITVEDSGVGMDPASVENVNQGIFRDEEGNRIHVGLANSYQRIRHFYGEESSLKIVSAVGEGTQITIRLRKEKENESFDR